jgi:hypothetical protein
MAAMRHQWGATVTGRESDKSSRLSDSDVDEICAELKRFLRAMADMGVTLGKPAADIASIEKDGIPAVEQLCAQAKAPRPSTAATVECEKCCFRYGAEHTLADGSYECPVCELSELKASAPSPQVAPVETTYVVGRMNALRERAERAELELHNIANAERFNKERFRDDTEFADWAQSRCRHTLAQPSHIEPKEPK